MKPSLIVHGGAWNIPDEAIDACKSGCERALRRGWSILSRGGHALDAIEATVMVLDDDPALVAGTDKEPWAPWSSMRRETGLPRLAPAGLAASFRGACVRPRSSVADATRIPKRAACPAPAMAKRA